MRTIYQASRESYGAPRVSPREKVGSTWLRYWTRTREPWWAGRWAESWAPSWRWTHWTWRSHIGVHR